MNLQEIGNEVRRFRRARGLSQSQLAAAAGITRTTLSQLENGVIKDLGIRKILAVLDHLGLEIAVGRTPLPKRSDLVRVASTSASVSFKTAITERELLNALLTGNVPPDRGPHLRALLQEAAPALAKGLVEQLRRSMRPGRLERNLDKLAKAVGLSEVPVKWLIRA